MNIEIDDIEEDNEILSSVKVATSLEKVLRGELFGQDRAIDAIVQSFKGDLGKKKQAPKATYLFLGSPATGKTFLAELMTKNLENYHIRTFDMTQYQEQNGGELYGYPKGWSGYSTGQLTGFVHDHPKSIIVLDNFEKADNVIQTNLLSIFEGGMMRDACGWDRLTDQPCNDVDDKVYTDENANFLVDFRESIFIITTSLGQELYSDSKFVSLVEDDYVQAESMILDALKRETKAKKTGGIQKAIIPELISRFSQATIVLFNKLNYTAYDAIGKKAFLAYAKEYEKQYKLHFKEDKQFNDFMITQTLIFAPQLDARRIKNKIGAQFFTKIIDYILDKNLKLEEFSDIKVSVAKNVQEFIHERILSSIEEERLVKDLFRKNTKLEIEHEISTKDKAILYKVKSCKFKQVKRIRDFSEDGLVFDIPKVSFDDIAGHSIAKTRLKEVINFLKEPKLLKEFDVEPPKGMLLYGPPGTGKTMLAKAFAHEAELPFISITGVELLQLEKIKKVFAKAKEYAPAIIFIDEIDTIGMRQKDNNREVQINKFLAEMDGFSTSEYENIFVVAATNYKENLDAAIIRPGRIEIHIKVEHLDKEAREYFINKILKEKPTSGKFDMQKLLTNTAGMTGAQLELVSKEASYYCIRHGIEKITQEVLLDEIHKVKFGENKGFVITQTLLEKSAIKEAAHIVTSLVLQEDVSLKEVSVIPSETSEAFASKHFEGLRSEMSIEDIKNRMVISLAGRVALVRKFGKIQGTKVDGSADLKQAMSDASFAITQCGMDEELKYIHREDKKQNENKVDDAIARWMSESEERTNALVEQHWQSIEILSKELLQKEILQSEELEAFHSEILS